MHFLSNLWQSLHQWIRRLPHLRGLLVSNPAIVADLFLNGLIGNYCQLPITRLPISVGE